MAIEIDDDVEEIDFGSPLRQSLGYGATKNPDAHAKVVSIADREKLPVDLVERKLPELDRPKPRIDIDSLEFDSPVTARALIDPDTAAMVHDDLDNLASLERIYKKQQSATLSARHSRGVKRGLVSLGVGAEAAARLIDEALSGAGRLLLPKPRGASGEEWDRDKIELSQGSAGLQMAAKEHGKIAPDQKTEEFTRLVSSAAESEGTAAAIAKGIGYLAKNPSVLTVLLAEQAGPMLLTAPLAPGVAMATKPLLAKITNETIRRYAEKSVVMAGIQFGANVTSMYGAEIAQGLNEGMPVDAALARARNKSIAEAGTNAAFSFIPIPGGRVSSTMLETLKQGVAGATGAAVGSEAVGETLTLAEGMLEFFGEATTAPVDLAIAGRALYQDKLYAEEKKQRDQILKSSIDQMKLDELVVVAQANLLGGRDSKRFNLFMQTVVEEYGEDAQVYIDGDEVAEIVRGLPPEEEGVRDLQRQLDQGGDIVIPLEHYIADLSRGPAGEAIRPHARLDADGLSMVELEEGVPLMEARIKEIMAKADEEAADMSKVDEISDLLYSQLIETGRVSPQIAKASSVIIPLYAAAKAKEYGMSVDAMYEKLNFGGVKGPDTPVAPGDALAQAAADGYTGGDKAEAAEWIAAVRKFGKEGMTLEARKARAEAMGFNVDSVRYHGSGNIADIAEGGFDPSLTGKGNDQYGSGFYFTSSPSEASGYTDARIDPGTEKIGGEVGAGIVPVYLRVENPVKIDANESLNINDDVFDLSPEQVRVMLGYSKALKRGADDESMNPAGDHFESFWESGVESWMLDDLAEKYSGPSIESIEMELFDDEPEAFRRALSEVTGYDGVQVELPNGNTHTVAWFSEQVRSINAAFDPSSVGSANLLAQTAEGQDVFFSNMAVALDKKLSKTINPKELAKQLQDPSLRGKWGIKAEEVEWAGIVEWLNEQEGKITKQDVADFIAANQVEVSEVKHGGAEGISSEEIELLAKEAFNEEYNMEEFLFDEAQRVGQEAWGDSNHYVWAALSEDKKGFIADFGGDEAAAQADFNEAVSELSADEIIEPVKYAEYQEEAWALVAAEYIESQKEGAERDPDISSTEYSGWMVPGDAENYTELLLTFPDQRQSRINSINRRVNEIYDGSVGFELSEQARSGIERLTKEHDRVADAPTADDYQSSHFSELNILAHVRYDERVDVDGDKVLFIHEIQSDWHQAGRKDGYQGDDRPALKERDIYVKEMQLKYGVVDDNTFLSSTRAAMTATEEDTLNALNSAFREEGMPGSSVPNAPFKGNAWIMLAMKKMIRHAAENGFDKVAWATGEQSAALYRLDKQVTNLKVFNDGDGLWDVSGDTANEGAVDIASGISSEKLADTIGKDMAKKVIETQTGRGWHTYEGADLKIGGEGMRSFYDKTVPNLVNKYIKKWGTKTGTVMLDEAQHGFTVTDKMRESVMSGQPLFSQKEDEIIRATFNIDDRVITLLEQSDPSSFAHEVGHLFLEMEKQLVSEFGVSSKQQHLLDWLEINSFDDATVEHHEKFARGFEAYLFEGKAPSLELASVFASFRRWMLGIYKTISRLRVNLTPEVRDFFDHMLATDDQIAEARNNPAYNQFFKGIKSAGMTDAGWAEYQAKQQASKDNAVSTLEQKILAQLKRKYTKEWAAEEEEIRDVVRGELMEQDVYRAVSFLRGELKIDGREDYKLSRGRVDEVLGLAPEKTKVDKNKVNSKSDTLLVAIAKLGGLDRDEAKAEGIDPENWRGRNSRTINQPMFGKMIFRKGGESFDSMAEKLREEGWNYGWTRELLDAVEQELNGEEVYSSRVDYELIYGEEKAPQKKLALPRKLWGMSKKVGLDPDEAALFLGYSSGDEMLNDIIAAPEMHDVEREVARKRMVSKHGDILNDGTLEHEARVASQNEIKAKVLLVELRALNKLSGVRQGIDREALKIGAKKTIAKAKISEIKPGRFYRAEIKAAEKAALAKESGDIEAAKAHKAQQLANHYLYREALDAQKRAVTMRQYAAKVGKEKPDTKKVQADFVQFRRVLAAAYDFKAVAGDEAQARASLLSVAMWVREQVNSELWVTPQFLDPTLMEMATILNSELLESEKNSAINALKIPHYKEMTVERLQGVYEMLKNLRYVGGQLSQNESLAYSQDRASDAESIRANTKRQYTPKEEESRGSRITAGWDQLIFDHVALPNMIDELDGDKEQGPVWESFRRIQLKATDDKTNLQRETFDRLKALFDPFSDIFTNQLKQGFVASKHAGHRSVKTAAGEMWSLSRRGRIMLGMYWGSQANRDMYLLGKPEIVAGDVDKMLATLTTKELDLVEGLWAVFDDLWPQVRDTSIKTTGSSPAQVPHTAFTVNGRVMKGGYMRLYYHHDSRDSFREGQDELIKKSRSGSRLAANTAHGSRIERVGSGGRAVSLELDNIFKALHESIHDVTHAEAARASYRYLSSKEIREAIEETYGPEFMKSLISASTNAMVGVQTEHGGFNSMLKYLRQNATLAALGYSVRNVVQQPVAMTNVFAKLGFAEAITGGMYHFAKNPMAAGKLIEEIKAKSTFMMYRAEKINREIAEISSRLSGAMGKGIYTELAFALQTAGDMLVAYPAWLAAYNKGLKDFKGKPDADQRATAYADKIIDQTVGSGVIGNMSPLLQGDANIGISGEMLKGLTFMGSFFNKVFQLMRDATRDAEFHRMIGFVPVPGSVTQGAEFVRQMMWILIVPAIVSSWIVADLPDEDDDEGWWEWMGKSVASYGLGTVFGVRDIAYLFNDFAQSSTYSRALVRTERTIDLAGKIAVGDKEATDPAVAAKLIRGIGALVPLAGAGQYARFLEGWSDWMETGDRNLYTMTVEGKQR